MIGVRMRKDMGMMSRPPSRTSEEGVGAAAFINRLLSVDGDASDEKHRQRGSRTVKLATASSPRELHVTFAGDTRMVSRRRGNFRRLFSPSELSQNRWTHSS